MNIKCFFRSSTADWISHSKYKLCLGSIDVYFKQLPLEDKNKKGKEGSTPHYWQVVGYSSLYLRCFAALVFPGNPLEYFLCGQCIESCMFVCFQNVCTGAPHVSLCVLSGRNQPPPHVLLHLAPLERLLDPVCSLVSLAPLGARTELLNWVALAE